ncbi:LysM peptidoglycan-binding domain-containing protein [Prosthecobacter sp.]|uniref:LysM peptidoglycan-binding domain-containing protein n=1 Tax=Prosthecobacter sp. TaxID=1965333 RepID=UPI0037843343
MTALRFLAMSATCLALAACENTKKSSSSDPYASNYGSDGHYNPYPGQTGYASSTTPKYQTPPAPNSFPSEPEAPANPYAFSGAKKTPPSSSSSGTKSSTTKKTVASSSTKKKTTTPSKSTAKKSTGSRYTVAKGDTLSAIARKKGSSVAKIKAANGLKSDMIRPGQALKIP